MLIFDAHLDLSLNALDWNRDLRLAATEIRTAEAGMDDLKGRGLGTVTLPDMRRGEVGICVATLLAPTSRPENPVPAWNSPQQSWAHMQGQLAWYRAMREAGEMVLIDDREKLERHLQRWENGGGGGGDKLPVGYILSLEGADPIVELAQLEDLYRDGLRALGPAHYGPGRYANGTDASGGLSQMGKDLIAEMDRLGIILDVSHLCDETFWEALELFGGSVWASHTNARALVPHNRQFSDEQYTALIARGAVIGVVADAWMLVPGWVRRESTPQEMGVRLETLIDHIDHICQLAGNADHVGIGSDLDGGFGLEQSPADIDTIADLQRLTGLLAGRGYAAEDIEKICSLNFVRILRDAWDKNSAGEGGPVEFDPDFLRSRREMWWIFVIWGLCFVWTLGYGALFGYGLEAHEITTTLGMPTWIFWGVALPWFLAMVSSIVFAMVVMLDHPLETVAGEGEEDDSREREGGS